MVQGGDKSGKIYVTHINIRQSIFFLLFKLVLLDLIFTFLAVLYFSSVTNKYLPDIVNNVILLYNLPFFLTLAFLKIVLTIYVVVRWITEYYEIWPNSIFHKRGFILKHEEKHPLSQMRSVRIEQDFFGRIFGFGTIYLYNWYLKTQTTLYLIHNPVKYFRIIENLIPRTEKEREIFLDDTESGDLQ